MEKTARSRVGCKGKTIGVTIVLGVTNRGLIAGQGLVCFG